MIYSEPEVLEHANQVWAREAAALAEQRTALLRKARGSGGVALSNLVYVAENLQNPSPQTRENIFTSTTPSASTMLLDSAWYNLDSFLRCRSKQAKRRLMGHLTSAVNDYILPMSNVKVQPNDAVTGRYSYRNSLATCESAELYFVSACDQAASDEGEGEHHQLSVYHDEQGKSLLLRKDHGISSSITLVPMVLGGVIVPQGSIVGLDSSMSQESRISAQKKRKHDWLTAYKVPAGKLAVTPIRLSPWAYDDPRDRAMFAVNPEYRPDISYDPVKGSAVQATTLDSFASAARHIIDACNAT